MRSISISKRLVALAVLIVTLSTSSTSSAVTYYVRKTGSDSNTGQAANKAYKTIKKAATVAGAGDIVYIGAGTYTDAITVSKTGTASQPIQFIADTNGAKTGDSGNVVVSGSTASLTVNGKDYIQFTGIKFAGTSSNSGSTSSGDDDQSYTSSSKVKWISAKGGVMNNCESYNGTDGVSLKDSEVTITNSTIRNHSHNGILVEGTSKLTVSGSTIRYCDLRGIFVVKGTAVTVENCNIYSNGNHGIRNQSSGSSDTLTVRRCTIYSNRDGVHAHATGKTHIENCLITANRDEGVHIHGGSGAVTIDHCTLVYNGEDGIDYDSGSGACTITNTIITYNFGNGLYKKGSNLSHSYNLVYGNFDRDYDGTSAGTGSFSANPKFLNLLDFHLQSGSPAIDKGTGTMDVDRDNVSRLSGAAVDIGCYERPGVATPPPPVGPDYYVRVTGNDTNNGRTPSTAFRTISKAVSVVQDGETIWVGAGTYNESPDLTGKTGSSDELIQIIADKTGAETGDSGTVTLNGGFYLKNSSYVVIDGFKITSASGRPGWSSYDAPIYMTSCSNITVQNLLISNGTYGIAGWQSTNVQAYNCVVSNATSHGIALFNASSASVRDCASTGNSSAGFYADSSNVQITTSSSGGNGTRGFHFVSSQGSVTDSLSLNDALAGEFNGINNDQNSLLVSNLKVEGSQLGGLILRNCTAQVTGGTIDFCSAGTYGAYLDNASLTLANATIKSTQYGVQAINGSDVTLNNCTVNSCSSDGLYLTASTASLVNCLVKACPYGVRGESSSTLNAANSTFEANTTWGVKHTGFGSLTNCVFTNNQRGIQIAGDEDRGDVSLSEVTIQGTTLEGLMATRCTATLTAGNDKLSKGGAYGIYLLDSECAAEDIQINGPQYGIQAYGSSLTLSGATVSGCQNDGIYLDGTTAELTTCAVNSCKHGIRGENASTLTAESCSFTGNQNWAIKHSGYGSVTNCLANANTQGIYLAGASAMGDVTIADTTIQGTTGEGLVAIRCTGNVLAGTDKLSKGGSYGAYLSESNITMNGISIAGPEYGIQLFDSTLNLTGSTISSCSLDGLYADDSAATLTSCSFNGCRYGVRGENGATVNATDCTFDSNTSWAFSNTGYGAIENCLLNNNYQGLYLTGASARGDITVTNTTIQGTSREGLVAIRCTGNVKGGATKFSSAGSYGAYLSDSDLDLTNLQITGADFGVMAYSSDLGLNTVQVSDCPSDGLYATQSTLNLTGLTVARCRNGILSENASTLTANSVSFDSCTGWGISHAGYGSISNCLINNCAKGAYLTGVSQPTDIQIASTTIQGSTEDGLVAIRCTGQVTGGNDDLSKGGTYGAYLSYSNLQLTDISITGSQRGVVALNSTLTLSNAAIDSTIQTGIYTEASSVNLSNGTISGCGSRGIDCQLDSTLNATDVIVENCNDWGLAVSGFGNLVACELLDNASGAYLIGKATRGDIQMTNLLISGCTGQGLSATRCAGTIIGGTSPFSQGGAAGIYSNNSNLVVTNATIDGSTNGVESTLSNLTVRSLLIKNTTIGILSDQDQALLVDTARLENCANWGVRQLQGSSQFSNCVLANAASGLSFDNPTQANVWNLTVTTGGNYGLYQNDGVVNVKNTIFVGGNQGVGMFRNSGVLNSSHSLVYGYATNFSGFTPDDTMISKNPRFADAASGDYRLTKGSPAINAGADLLGYVDADIASNPRPTFKKWEIGAYEFLEDSASLRVLQWVEKK